MSDTQFSLSVLEGFKLSGWLVSLPSEMLLLLEEDLSFRGMNRVAGSGLLSFDETQDAGSGCETSVSS